MRSTVFIILSVLLHLACVTALLIQQHSRKIEIVPSVDEAKSVDVEWPSAKGLPPPAEPVEKEPRVITRRPAPPKPKVAPETQLPAKVVSPDESNDPYIDESQMVNVIAPSETPAIADDVNEPSVTLLPAKKSHKQVKPDTTYAEELTEAGVDGSSMEDPTPRTMESSRKGGETEAQAVSYLELRQQAGNRVPVYPMSARLEGREGRVELVYRVTKDGRVENIKVNRSSGYEDLDQAALEAIEKFRFVPGQEGWARHAVNFTLTGKAALPPKLQGVEAQTSTNN